MNLHSKYVRLLALLAAAILVTIAWPGNSVAVGSLFQSPAPTPSPTRVLPTATTVPTQNPPTATSRPTDTPVPKTTITANVPAVAPTATRQPAKPGKTPRVVVPMVETGGKKATSPTAVLPTTTPVPAPTPDSREKLASFIDSAVLGIGYIWLTLGIILFVGALALLVWLWSRSER